jgi:hypothetical protein
MPTNPERFGFVRRMQILFSRGAADTVVTIDGSPVYLKAHLQGNRARLTKRERREIGEAVVDWLLSDLPDAESGAAVAPKPVRGFGPNQRLVALPPAVTNRADRLTGSYDA